MTLGVYTLDDLCELLGFTKRNFRKRRPQMEKAGFPSHLPGLRNRWPRAEVDSYLRQQVSDGDEPARRLLEKRLAEDKARRERERQQDRERRERNRAIQHE